MTAAYNGHEEVCQVLLDFGAEVNTQNLDGWTPLHVVADRGYANVCQLLIKNGANVNIPTNTGRTPLHWAVYWGKLDCCRVLTESGANLGIKNDEGQTPLDRARQEKRLSVVAFLEETMRQRWDTFCLATHRRVGENSDVRVLCPDVIGIIFNHLMSH
eukprot:c5029_g1_i1.p1 GENE.c5029_g1_i1~~c5029_g1_i1.p1  ORF type:complete len:158 (-),score=31.89 c5029_g1_i1:30-503(-)